MNKILFLKSILLCLTLLTTLPMSASAVGSGAFENSTFSPKSFSRGGAGTASGGEPAAISYNPATIVYLDGTQVQLTSHFLNLWTSIDSDVAGVSDHTSSATTNIVPTGYVTLNLKDYINKPVSLGVGVDSPFGFKNKYDSTHPATRYTGYKNWLEMLAIKPVLALKLSENISIGGGPIYYNIFDLGQVAAYPNAALVPATPDGVLRAEADGDAWGWHLGAHYQVNEKNSLGLYFRSPVNIPLDGRLKVENSVVSGNFETGIHSKIHLPLNISAGWNHRLNEKTDIEINGGFTRWSSFDNLSIIHNPIGAADDILLTNLLNAPGPTGAATKDYRNAFTLRIGGTHHLSEKFSINAGSYIFWTPVPKNHFTPVIPDSNRVAFGIGTTYRASKNLDIDLSYVAMFFLNRNIDNSISEPLGTSVDGEYSSYLSIISIGATYKWGIGEE